MGAINVPRHPPPPSGEDGKEKVFPGGKGAHNVPRQPPPPPSGEDGKEKVFPRGKGRTARGLPLKE